MGISRFFRRRRWDEERAREIAAHLAHEIDDLTARGLTREQARAAAHRKLGNAARIREEIYEFNSVRWLETLRFDLRDAWRHLRRRRFAGVIQSQLYGVAATDPRVLAAVATTVLVAAVLASLGPARRAARVDPAIVLRSE